MQDTLATALARARDLVRAGNPHEATRLIQAALAPPPGVAPQSEVPANTAAPHRIDPDGIPEAEVIHDPSESKRRKRRPLSEVLAGFRRATNSVATDMDDRRIVVPQGGRDYLLYVPPHLPDGPKGLILMLHGCTQSPADFAVGTRMNAHAATRGLIVAYPAQTRQHNAQSCWNWFRPADQARGGGEPAILAALAAELAAEFRLPPKRVFAAGLSAGGAMAAILGQAYPDIFSAVAVHSGLPAGAATDLLTALAAMRGDGAPPVRSTGPVRTITLHGTADVTVHPVNSAHIHGKRMKPQRSKGETNGRRYTLTRTLAPSGLPLSEDWQIDGLAHAWSGGDAAGSHADPFGPDASELILSFFLAT